MKRMPVCLTLILVLISICPATFSAENLTDTINQKLSPLNYSNADRVMEEIGSLVYNADDFPGLEIKGSERTNNKDSAFHCYKM
jgi:hypothetical protein